MKLRIWAASAAASISSVAASGRPKAMFSPMVAANSTVSCRTTPICERSDARVTPRRSMPSISIAPRVGSCRRSRSEIRVVLPDPVPPSTASRLPAGMVRSMSVSASGWSSPPNAKPTRRKRTSPRPRGSGRAFGASGMAIGASSISATRSADASPCTVSGSMAPTRRTGAKSCVR